MNEAQTRFGGLMKRAGNIQSDGKNFSRKFMQNSIKIAELLYGSNYMQVLHELLQKKKSAPEPVPASTSIPRMIDEEPISAQGENGIIQKTTDQKVKDRLAKKQENKTYKDTDYVPFSKKYKRNWGLISRNNLDEIEKDGVTAYKDIQKEKVWLPYDIEQLKAEGNSSGAAYLKIQIRKSLAVRPENKPIFRKVYVLTVNKVAELLDNCKTVKEIDKIYKTVKEWYNEEFGHKDEYTEIQSHGRWNGIEGEANFDKAKLIFSQNFINMLSRSVSDTTATHWHLAQNYEAALQQYTPEELEALEVKLSGLIEKWKNEIPFFENYPDGKNVKDLDEESSSRLNLRWKITRDSNTPRLKNSIVRHLKTIISEKEAKLKGLDREEDWSWATITKERAVKAPAEVTDGIPVAMIDKNKPRTPLAHIVRTGGLKITDKEINTDFVKKELGFYNVTFGTYVNDAFSKQSLKFFIMSMVDLAEVMNFNLKEINQFADLTIGFGAFGGGTAALATYYHENKAINLTKKRGDGCICHEWGHFFDNIAYEGKKKTANTPKFDGMATLHLPYFKEFISKIKLFDEPTDRRMYFRKIGQVSNSDNSFFTSMFDYINTVDEAIKVFNGEIVIPAERFKSTQMYDYFNRNVNRIKTNFASFNISSYGNRTAYEDWYGLVCNKFDMPYIEVTVKTFNTDFYIASYYQDTYRSKAYWTTPVEMFARAFESVVKFKLEQLDRKNNYLVNIQDGASAWITKPNELIRAEVALDKLIRQFKAENNIGNFVPFTTERQDIDTVQTLKGLDDGLDFAVWHGSPHKFDKFTTEKMGTGEGVQAYGWGLYFADKDEVARDYANKLAAKMRKGDWIEWTDEMDENYGMKLRIRDKDGDLIDYLIIFEDADTLLISKNLSILNKPDNTKEYKDLVLSIIQTVTIGLFQEKGKVHYKSFGNQGNNELSLEQVKSFLIEEIKSLKILKEPNRNLYKVKIHGDKTFGDLNLLDWDKPVPNWQIELIKKAGLTKISDSKDLRVHQSSDGYAKWVVFDMDYQIRRGLSYDTEEEAVEAKEKILRELRTGSQLYKNLSEELGEDPKAASLALLKLGIDGIRYCNGQTRHKGCDEFNYVIFDENAVEIEHHSLYGLNGIESPEFKKWFGNSKVVNKAGKPLVVAHGTPKGKFDVFKLKNERDTGWFGKGYYFTPDLKVAEGYAHSANFIKKNGERSKPYVFECYLSLQNPLDLDNFTDKDADNIINAIDRMINDYGKYQFPDEEKQELRGKMHDANALTKMNLIADYGEPAFTVELAGYDGILAESWGQYVAFRSNQIKSVNNKGTWDMNKDSILEGLGKPITINQSKMFQSAAERIYPFPVNTYYNSAQDILEVTDADGGIVGMLDVKNDKIFKGQVDMFTDKNTDDYLEYTEKLASEVRKGMNAKPANIDYSGGMFGLGDSGINLQNLENLINSATITGK